LRREGHNVRERKLNGKEGMEREEKAHLEVLSSLLSSEGARVLEEVAEENGDGTVDVEDEGVLLGGGDVLDGEGVLEHRGRGEVGEGEVLDELDTLVGVPKKRRESQ
jgi:hypothetical protein